MTAANGDQEGIPTSIMEAMANGLLVVSTRHSGIPELVEDKVSGRLAEEKDVDGLVSAIKDLIADPDIQTRYRRAGFAKVQQEFNIETLNDRLRDSLQELTTQTRSTAS